MSGDVRKKGEIFMAKVVVFCGRKLVRTSDSGMVNMMCYIRPCEYLTEGAEVIAVPVEVACNEERKLENCSSFSIGLTKYSNPSSDLVTTESAFLYVRYI